MHVKSIYNQELITNNKSLHIKERKERVSKYKGLLSFKMLYCFRVDNNHCNGDEIHCINEYGLIYIYNYHTKKYITILHPRPKQLKRYFQQLNIKLPKDVRKLIDNCYKRNEKYKLNDV